MTSLDLLRSIARAILPHEIRVALYRSLKRRKIGRHALTNHQRLLTEAKAHYVSWDLEAALRAINLALVENPESQKGMQMKAQVLLSMGRHEQAKDAANSLISRYPVDKQGRKILSALGEPLPPASKEVAMSFALASRGRPMTYVQGAQYLYDAELFQDALDFVTVGLAALSNEADVKRRSIAALDLLKIRADSLEALHRFPEAMAVFEQLLHNRSSQLRGAAGMARCMLELGEPDKAENILRAANSRSSDQNPWSPLMLDILQAQNKILDSYKLYRKKPVSIAIAEFFGMPGPSEINLLSGAYREANAFLLSEGGPGDELRLSSVYPDLQKHFKRLCISSDPRLTPIMQRTYPEIEFLPVGRYRAEVARDMSDRTEVGHSGIIQCVSNDAVAFGRSADFVASVLDTLADVRPNRESFLSSPRRPLQPLPHLRDAWRDRIKATSSGRRNVGIAWRSMLQSVARNRHYFDVEACAPIFSVDAQFWIMQPCLRGEERDYLATLPNVSIVDDLDMVDDMEGQLAMSSCLDLVISPFTATGELAGAAGIPTLLVAATRSPLWRRNPDGSDIFAPNVTILAGSPVYDKTGAVAETVKAIGDKMR